jgi:hypothetical protein
MIHLVKDDRVNLQNVEAFVTLLEEAYGDPIHMNTAEWALAKLCQGNRDFVAYYVEFQRLIVDLKWNHMMKHTAFYRGLSEEPKNILSTQTVPKEWSHYVAVVKKRDM